MREGRIQRNLISILFLALSFGIVAYNLWNPYKADYALMTLVLAVLSVLFVLVNLDKKTTHIRRLVLIAVMTALSVLGRFLFAFVPAFKPMTAVIVLCGMYLGREAGFLCGALTAVVSNFYFGQGPWTPFQMLAFGLIGFLSGILGKGLKRSRILLGIYALFAGVFYSFFMDIWTVLWAQGEFVPEAYYAAIASALPFMLMYALSNFVFLQCMRGPFGEKMERIIAKYKV